MAAGGKSFIPAVVGFGFICVLVAVMFSKCGHDSDDVVPTLTANANRRDGTAVYLLLDVSGSMDDDVKNDKGADEAKIEIAKRSAIEVCKSVNAAAEENKQRTIQMAIACFSDKFTLQYPMAAPDLPKMKAAIDHLGAGGQTAIGTAVLNAQKALDATGLKNQHILIVTDGENNVGVSPEKVAQALAHLPKELQPTVWVVAFDVNADVFSGVKAQGWTVYSAANGAELKSALDIVVGQHILLEK